MTFLTELERLKGAATKGPYLLVKGIAGRPTITGDGFDNSRSTIAEFCNDPEGWADAKSFLLFLNHADALAELVRAAEQISRRKRYSNNPKMIISSTVQDEHWLALDEALAKLNGTEQRNEGVVNLERA